MKRTEIYFSKALSILELALIYIEPNIDLWVRAIYMHVCNPHVHTIFDYDIIFSALDYDIIFWQREIDILESLDNIFMD